MLEHLSKMSSFSAWRIFVLVCSLPSLLSLVIIYFLPETPKYLMSKRRYEDARHVFQNIFSRNTGQSKYFYPVLSLEGEFRCKEYQYFNDIPLRFRILTKLEKTFDTLKELFSQPYLTHLGIISFADFGLMASYYTLVMWFPEIFERFNTFETHYPNATSGVCVISEKQPEHMNLLTMIFSFDMKICDPSIDNRVFMDTVIIGLSCIPTSVSLSYSMKFFGKKNVLVVGLVSSGLSTLLLNLVKNSTQTLILSCCFESLTSVLEAVLFCVVVDLFPTNLRAIALAVSATSGRIGAILGNVIFGILIDINCAVPIYLFGFLLIGSGILCLALPRNETYIILN